MSGTFRLSLPNSSTMQLFPDDPIAKRWTPTRVATGGQGEPIFAAFWQVELSFGSMSRTDNSFFESRLVAGGLYNFVGVHPITGQLVGFTGTAIEDYSFEFNDVERNSWVDNPVLRLRVNLYATGSF